MMYQSILQSNGTSDIRSNATKSRSQSTRPDTIKVRNALNDIQENSFRHIFPAQFLFFFYPETASRFFCHVPQHPTAVSDVVLF
jgi:hypothetical protein